LIENSIMIDIMLATFRDIGYQISKLNFLFVSILVLCDNFGVLTRGEIQSY